MIVEASAATLAITSGWGALFVLPLTNIDYVFISHPLSGCRWSCFSLYL